MLLALVLLASAPQSIFDGKTLAGWRHYGPRATFAAANGELATSGLGNYPNWIGTTAEYENFRLSFEYKLAKWAETSVLLRAPEVGRPAQAGLSLFLAHDFHKQISKHVTGSLAGVLPPLKALPESDTFEKWHRVEIVLDGDHFVARIDETVVQDVRFDSHPELRLRLKRGHIGFQDLGHKAAFRNIVLQDLGDRTAYTQLFNGRSIEEWKLRGGGNFLVRDGAIAGENGHGVLYAPPVFENFELTVAVRSHNRVNAGIFLRGSPDEKKPRGFEVQIYSPPDAVYQTGSIYGIERSRSTGDFEERWFLMQIRVEGSHCLVRLDGETVAETDQLPEAVRKPGQIGLQIHMEDASVDYRDLRVRRL